jgi:2-methylcitrate dehydratase PrpD
MMHLILLEKQEHAKPKTSRRREILKIRAKINTVETKAYKQSMQKNIVSLKKINTIDRPLANLTKMRREKNTN